MDDFHTKKKDIMFFFFGVSFVKLREFPSCREREKIYVGRKERISLCIWWSWWDDQRKPVRRVFVMDSNQEEEGEDERIECTVGWI
jgi:hypothetical protein